MKLKILKDNYMKKRLFKTILFGALMGLCVVLGRWIIESIFNIYSFSGGYFYDFLIGVSVFILLSLVSEFYKIKKENKNYTKH